MSTPIAGNQNFTRVESLARNLSNVNVTDLKATTLSVGGAFSLNGRQNLTAVGYTPNAPLALTSAAGVTPTLLNAPGVAAAVTTDPRIVSLPAGAVVTRVTYVGENGYTNTGGTVNLGFGTLNAGGGDELIDGGDEGLANGAVAAERVFPAPVAATGAVPTLSAPAAPGNLLNVSVLTAAVTAGNLRVVVEYYV